MFLEGIANKIKKVWAWLKVNNDWIEVITDAYCEIEKDWKVTMGILKVKWFWEIENWEGVDKEMSSISFCDEDFYDLIEFRSLANIEKMGGELKGSGWNFARVHFFSLFFERKLVSNNKDLLDEILKKIKKVYWTIWYIEDGMFRGKTYSFDFNYEIKNVWNADFYGVFEFEVELKNEGKQIEEGSLVLRDENYNTWLKLDWEILKKLGYKLGEKNKIRIAFNKLSF